MRLMTVKGVGSFSYAPEDGTSLFSSSTSGVATVLVYRLPYHHVIDEEVQPTGLQLLRLRQLVVLVAQMSLGAAAAAGWKRCVARLERFGSDAAMVLGHYLGFPYLAVTLFLSIRFLLASRSMLSNDLFWTNFNATSGGVFVTSIFNYLLLNHQHTSIQLTNPEYAVFGALPANKAAPAFATHTLLYHQLNTPQHAITSLRYKESMPHLLFQPTQFCWVDFDRYFSLAHTAKRAERCLASETTNGAVYLESYLRNVDSDMFLALWRKEFSNGIEQPLKESAQGRQFLGTMSDLWANPDQLSVDEEVAYWRSKSITHFTMQWGNVFMPGVSESIDLVSALGTRVSFMIKKVDPSAGVRTTMKMSWPPGNELWAVGDNRTVISGMSLVRGTTKFYENFNISMEKVLINNSTLPWPLVGIDQVLRKELGPFGSIDIKHQAAPASLFDLVTMTNGIVNTILMKDLKAQDMFRKLPTDLLVNAFPEEWRVMQPNSTTYAWTFVDGNPLCSSGVNVSVPAEGFDLTDSCGSSRTMLGIRLTQPNLLIALIAQKNPSYDAFPFICGNASLDVGGCVGALNVTSQFIDTYLPQEDQQLIQSLAEKARTEVLQVNPQLIQFVKNRSNTSQYDILRLPMLSAVPNHPWNVLGWCFAVDWSVNSREVIRLEGDDGSMTLISKKLSNIELIAAKDEIPTSLSLSLLRVVQYTTLVCIVCAFLALVYTITSHGRVAGGNFFKFNRVVGAVWIGRPLLIARSVVAICMISTSDVSLTQYGTVTKLDETREPWYNVLIASGEACWLSIVITDVLVTFTQGYTYRYALIGDKLTQLLGAVVDWIKPFQHKATLNLQCDMPIFFEQVVCHAGTVEIGSLSRFLTTAAIAIGVTMVMLVVMRTTLVPIPDLPGGHLILSGIAKEVFSTTGWVHDGQWFLDKASAAMAGLVTFPFGRYTRVLDVKTWTLLYLHNNRLSSMAPKGGKPNTCSLPQQLKGAMALTIGFHPSIKAVESAQGNKRQVGRICAVAPAPSTQTPVVAFTASTDTPVTHSTSCGGRSMKLLKRITSMNWRQHLSLPYVIMTLALSVRFLTLSMSSLTTDMLWSDFNPRTTGLFVVNLFNTMLPNGANEAITITNAEFSMFGGQSSAESQAIYSSAYARTLLYHRLNTPEIAIASLRQESGALNSIRHPTPLCWVDLNRNFSLAHTAKRAERCLANEVTNGAAYLETILRNVDGVKFNNLYRERFTLSIVNPLKESAEGRAFLDALFDLWNKTNTLTVDQEASYWRSKGITHFTIQWGNLYSPELSEHVSIVNALGVSTDILIKTLPVITLGPYTISRVSKAPFQDMGRSATRGSKMFNMSIIRGTSQFYEKLNVSVEDMVNPAPLKPIDQLVHEAVGPFGSIDMKQQLYPASLVDLVMKTTRMINTKLLNSPEAQTGYNQVPATNTINVFPIAWRPLQNNSSSFVWSYLGGSPLCNNVSQIPYAQKLVDWWDKCTQPAPEVVQPSRVMLVISMLADGTRTSDAFESICASGTTNTTLCVEMLRATSEFITAYLSVDEQESIKSLAQIARKDVLQSSPELIQFVASSDNASHIDLLHQSVLSGEPSAPWNVFGWWYAVGWATGHREVIRFEGDSGALTLISAEVPFTTMNADSSKIPSSMASSLLRVVQYTTFVFIFCGSLVFLYTLTSVSGTNLFEFSRVAGAVWIGRPLLVARGIVAMCLLGTSRIIVKAQGSMTMLEQTRTSWFDVMIAAGESSWLSYVTMDVLVHTVQGYTYSCALVSGLLSQLIIALIEFINPVEPKAEINLQCTMIAFNWSIKCYSATVEIGFLSRLQMLTVVPVGVTLAMMMVVRWVTIARPQVEGGQLLLCGLANEVYSSKGWVHNGQWYLDKASAALTGLVTFQFGRFSRVLDVKTWTLLYLQGNRLLDTARVQHLRTDDSALDDGNSRAAFVVPARYKNAIALTLTLDGEQRITEQQMDVREAKCLKWAR